MPRPPLLATEITPELAETARELVARIRDHAHPRELRREAAQLVARLTEAGLAGYFLRPVEELELGVVAVSTARVGLRSAAGGIAMVVRRLVDGMSDDQLRKLADTVERLIRDGGRR